MAGTKITITKLDFLEKIKQFIETNPLRPKNQKLDLFANVTEILNDFGVTITSPPEEKEIRKKWQNEREKLKSAFGRLLDDKKKYEKNKDLYTITDGIFFDSDNFKLLAKISKTDNDPDFLMDLSMGIENDMSESELKHKSGGRPKSVKPLFEFGDTVIREKTDEILNYLVKKSSELDAPFDRLVAKCCMRYYFTSGENFNKKKGQMFNEVQWLHLNNLIYCYTYIFFSSKKSNYFHELPIIVKTYLKYSYSLA